MKTINNVVINDDKGEPVQGEKGEPIKSITLIRAIVNNSDYDKREEQKILDKLEDKLKDEETLTFEDTEFALLVKYAEKYKPLLRGTLFTPFLDELENPQE